MPLGIPSEITASPGQILTAAEWNTNVRDGINFLLNPPMFQGYQATAQSIPNSAWTPLTIDTNIYDPYTSHSTTVNPSYWAAQLTGWYQVTLKVQFASNSTGARGVAIGVNSTTAPTPTYFQVIDAGATSGPGIQVTGMLAITVAPTNVVALCYQSSGSALSTVGSASFYETRWVHG